MGKNLPGAYPITGFPAGASGGAAKAATTTTVGSHHVISTRRGVLLGCTALEAARAASKVVSSTVSHIAVPVTRADIRASGEAKRGGAASATAKAATVVTSSTAKGVSVVTSCSSSWLPTSLARFSSLEVEVAACPAVPISWSAHFPFTGSKMYSRID